MRRLAWNASFQRTFKHRTRHSPASGERVFQVLEKLAEDPFHPTLKTHKLSGQLRGLWACWVEYDCRIVFPLEPDPAGREETIILVDIGTHDEVY